LSDPRKLDGNASAYLGERGREREERLRDHAIAEKTERSQRQRELERKAIDAKARLEAWARENEKDDSAMRIVLDLKPEEIDALTVLGLKMEWPGAGETEVVRALLALVHHVVDGVERPGSWERPWLCQVFGETWTELCEQDPDVPYKQIPKPPRPRRSSRR